MLNQKPVRPSAFIEHPKAPNLHPPPPHCHVPPHHPLLPPSAAFFYFFLLFSSSLPPRLCHASLVKLTKKMINNDNGSNQYTITGNYGTLGLNDFGALVGRHYKLKKKIKKNKRNILTQHYITR